MVSQAFPWFILAPLEGAARVDDEAKTGRSHRRLDRARNLL